MNKRQLVVLFCFAGSVTVALAFDRSAQLKKSALESGQSTKPEASSPLKQTSSSSQSQRVQIEDKSAFQKVEVPEHMLYDQMFRLIVQFKKRAEEQQAKGERVTPLRDYFQNEAKLNIEQTRILQDIAARFVEEVGIIDSQARVIIENARARVPKGQSPLDRKSRIPPPELKDLQKKREELALRYRDHLRDQLGPEQFRIFQDFVEHGMRKVITAVPSKAMQPVETKDGSSPLPRRRLN